MFEPSIDVVPEDLRGIRRRRAQVARSAASIDQDRSAQERLLSISGHDRRTRTATVRRIACAPFVLVDQPRTAPRIAPRQRSNRADEQIDPPGVVDAQHAETETSTKLAETRVVLAPATPFGGGTGGKPDFIAGGRAIHPLQDEFEIEAQLQFAHDDDRRIIAFEGDEIASPDLAFHREAEIFQEAFDREIKRGFQIRNSAERRHMRWRTSIVQAALHELILDRSGSAVSPSRRVGSSMSAEACWQRRSGVLLR